MQIRIDRPQSGDLPQLRSLWREAFGDPDALIDDFFRTAYLPERCRCLTVDGTVAAALYWLDCTCRGARIAYLYAIATAEAYRGRGFCRALMAETHRVLAEEGYRGAILVPAEPSLFGLYERMGYRTATFSAEVKAEASDAGDALPIRRIDGATYATLRRAYLPDGGVVQEGETVAFLETQYALYAGEDFLLAASEEDGQIFGTELLGDVRVLPRLLYALNASSGVFRTVGSEAPLSMYLPLAKDAPTPSYFGLPLD